METAAKTAARAMTPSHGPHVLCKRTEEILEKTRGDPCGHVSMRPPFKMCKTRESMAAVSTGPWSNIGCLRVFGVGRTADPREYVGVAIGRRPSAREGVLREGGRPAGRRASRGVWGPAVQPGQSRCDPPGEATPVDRVVKAGPDGTWQARSGRDSVRKALLIHPEDVLEFPLRRGGVVHEKVAVGHISASGIPFPGLGPDHERFQYLQDLSQHAGGARQHVHLYVLGSEQ